jgi:SpoVK/Ycf46/Vps4 family AAA+-type ATPase
MQAGWNGKDHITVMTCLRWRYSKLKSYLSVKIKQMQLETIGVPVELMLPYGTDKLGSLKEAYPQPIVEEYLWKDFEEEVFEVSDGKRKRTSTLLYGLPGNGKTSFIKYLATKYRLPIMIFTLDPEWNNHDLLLLFSQIPKRCIVLFEDFDNYFHGRKCIMGGENKFVKFTFDIILNGLDGVYTTHENVVFVMTVNDISKVDSALRNRPSRFKYTRHFDNPSLNVRKKILPEDWALKSDGLNLDQIFRLSEYQERGISFDDSMKMLEKVCDENKETSASDLDIYVEGSNWV